MFEGVLRQFRKKVRTRQYVVTVHADEEMDEDGLTVFDVESAVLTAASSSSNETDRLGNENTSCAVRPSTVR